MDKLPQRRTVVDPAVADLLSDMERKRKISNLPKSSQNKARKDAARHKIGLDLPPHLHSTLLCIAHQEQISMSGLAAYFLFQGITAYNQGQVDLSALKRISRCAKFDYVLDFENFDIS